MTKKKSETAIKRPPILFKETQSLIKKLGEHFDGDFISWVPMNDSSTWSKLMENTEGGHVETKFYIN